MSKFLKPDESIEKVTDIDLQGLLDKGIQGLILDLDNTIVPWGGSNPDDDIKSFVERAKGYGFRLCIISNAPKERVQTTGKILGLPGIWYAKKPLPPSLRQAQKDILNLPPQKVAIVGDQIFTDILGGNLLGFYTILVEPITKKDFIATKLFRFLERVFHLR